MEPYKNSCDHCGVVVDKKSWTFNMDQCVVCSDPVCKAKQRAILRRVMDEGAEAILQKMINERKTNE